MLERSAGLKLFACTDTAPRPGRAGGCLAGISLVVLGGCMTLGGTPPPPAVDSPPVADSRPLPLQSEPVSTAEPAAVNISMPAVRPVKPAPHEKKRRAQNTQQVASAHVPPAKGSTIDPGRLIGMAPAAVRELLGPPLKVENYDLSREWVYASNGCSFRLFFYPNLNTAAFRVLKYGGNDGNGELMDVSDVCIRHILTARKNATG